MQVRLRASPPNKLHEKALHRESLLIEWSRGARAWWGDERRRQAKTTAGNNDGGPVTTASPKSKVQGYVLDSELCKRAARAVRAGGKSGRVCEDGEGGAWRRGGEDRDGC